MNFKKVFLLSFIISLGVITGKADVTLAEPQIEFEGYYWLPDLSAEGRVSKSGIGTDIDFKNDLGLDDENFPEARFTWYMGPKSRLRLSYIQVGYSGDKHVAKTIDFNGKTYAGNTRVVTDLEAKYARFGLINQFINIADGKVKFGPLIELKGFWVDASLEAPDLSLPIKESEDFAIGLPTLGFALDIAPHKKVNLFAEVSGMPAGNYGYFFDGEAGIKIIPIENLSIAGGYRVFKIEAKNDSDYADLDISGPFIGATLRF